MINLITNPLVFTNAWKDDPPAPRGKRDGKQAPAKPEAAKPAPALLPVSPAAPKATAASAPAGSTLIKGNATLVQNMDHDDPKNWEMADWSNDAKTFLSTFRSSNLSFRNGIMSITLDNEGCPGSCDGRPVASGEYRTNKEIYGHGDYEIRLKPAAGSGLMAGSFFTYTGTYGAPDHYEIDMEFLGQDPNCRTLHTNYYAAGVGNGAHVKDIKLNFNACQEFHNYGFRWAEDNLSFYVDGKQVRQVDEGMPSAPSKIMTNLWAGAPKERGWLGTFKYPGHPVQAQIDWIKYKKPTFGAEAATTPAPEPEVAAPKKSAASASIKPLSVKSLSQGTFDFNGGKMSYASGIYKFSAQGSRDPGVGILTGGADLQGRNTLKFGIKGSLTKLGQYARLIAQVYSQGDSDSSPSVSLESVKFSKDWSEVSIDLRGEVAQVKKVQFLLVTDKGSCSFEIRDPRFE